MRFIVYKTTNKITNQYYIGVHKIISDEFDGYLGSGSYLKNAIRKYGKSNFTRETLFKFDSEEDALSMENEIVNANFLDQKLVYNMTVGGGKPPMQQLFGEMNPMKNPEISKKVATKLRGRSLSKEHKNKIKKSKTGKRIYSYPKNRKKTWKWITNGISNIRIFKSDLIPAGYVFGLTKFWKTGYSTNSKAVLVCPNCNKIGGVPAMKRWHFENCKFIQGAR